MDITSPTALQAYAVLQVPEIWRYHNRTLQIAVWHDGRYSDTPHSPTFPQVSVSEAIAQCVEMSHVRGTAPALRAFRQWVREHLQPYTLNVWLPYQCDFQASWCSMGA